jgi:hypothetical protein
MKYKSKFEERAVKYFNKFICLRDLQKDDKGNIFGICISSGKKWVAVLNSNNQIMNGREWCASHYWNADKYGSVRFDERNVNGQFSYLNTYAGGDKSNYERGLKNKLGEAGFEELNRDRHKLKQNFFNYPQIAEVYRVKCQEQRGRLGIKI